MGCSIPEAGMLFNLLSMANDMELHVRLLKFILLRIALKSLQLTFVKLCEKISLEMKNRLDFLPQ